MVKLLKSVRPHLTKGTLYILSFLFASLPSDFKPPPLIIWGFQVKLCRQLESLPKQRVVIKCGVAQDALGVFADGEMESSSPVKGEAIFGFAPVYVGMQ